MIVSGIRTAAAIAALAATLLSLMQIVWVHATTTDSLVGTRLYHRVVTQLERWWLWEVHIRD